MNVQHMGLYHNSFLMEISRAIERVPSKNAGFVLQFKFFNPNLEYYCQSKRGTYSEPSRTILDRNMDLEIWLPNIHSIYVMENNLKIVGDFLYISPYFDDGTKKDVITLNSNDIKGFRLQYDDYLAIYNGECVTDEQRRECEIEEYNT